MSMFVVHLLTAKMPTLSWMMFVKFHTEDPVLELVRPFNTLLKTYFNLPME